MVIAGECGRPLSTVATVMKDRKCIREVTFGTMKSKMTTASRKCEGPISEMEQQLTRWIRDCINKDIPLNLKQIQKKAISHHKPMKKELGMEGAS